MYIYIIIKIILYLLRKEYSYIFYSSLKKSSQFIFNMHGTVSRMIKYSKTNLPSISELSFRNIATSRVEKTPSRAINPKGRPPPLSPIIIAVAGSSERECHDLFRWMSEAARNNSMYVDLPLSSRSVLVRRG